MSKQIKGSNNELIGENTSMMNAFQTMVQKVKAGVFRDVLVWAYKERQPETPTLSFFIANAKYTLPYRLRQGHPRAPKILFGKAVNKGF